MLNAHSSAYFFLKGQGARDQRRRRLASPSCLATGLFQHSTATPSQTAYLKVISTSHGLLLSSAQRKTSAVDGGQPPHPTAYTEVDNTLMAKLEHQEPLAYAVLKTQLEHTDKLTGNWPLANDSRIKDAFWPEIQNAVLGRKEPKAAMDDVAKSGSAN